MILALLIQIWQWFVGGGYVYFVIAILAVLGLVGLYQIIITIIDERYQKEGRRLEELANRSLSDEMKYQQHLKKYREFQIQQAGGLKAYETKVAAEAAQERERARRNRWYEDPTGYVRDQLRMSRVSCNNLTTLADKAAFIAYKEATNTFVLGGLSPEGVLTGRQSLRASKIIAILTGNQPEVLTSSQGSDQVDWIGENGLNNAYVPTEELCRMTLYFLVNDKDKGIKTLGLTFTSPKLRDEWIELVKSAWGPQPLRTRRSARKPASLQQEYEELAGATTPKRPQTRKPRSDLTTYLSQSLEKAGTPCKHLTMLAGQGAFIALTDLVDGIVLGQNTPQGRIRSREVIKVDQIEVMVDGSNAQVHTPWPDGSDILQYGSNASEMDNDHSYSVYLVIRKDLETVPFRRVVFSGVSDHKQWLKSLRTLTKT